MFYLWLDQISFSGEPFRWRRQECVSACATFPLQTRRPSASIRCRNQIQINFFKNFILFREYVLNQFLKKVVTFGFFRSDYFHFYPIYSNFFLLRRYSMQFFCCDWESQQRVGDYSIHFFSFENFWPFI